MSAGTTVRLDIANEAQMHAVAANIACATRPGLVLTLAGPLAAGKTSFARGFLRGLGHTGPVKSPTFTLVESYSLVDFVLHHFDLYRIMNPQELDYFGFDDYVRADTVCLIEWPAQGGTLLPVTDLALDIEVVGAEQRALRFAANTASGQKICDALKGFQLNS